ncbi:MAG: hypothetical protein WDN46_07845 [Methylocella sp.]
MRGCRARLELYALRPIHAKAMPVLLTTPDQWDTWLEGSLDQALALQRPLTHEKLRVCATGDKTDAAGSHVPGF